MLLWALVGGVLIGVVLLDAFETIVLPRRVARAGCGSLAWSSGPPGSCGPPQRGGTGTAATAVRPT
jgi:hypothetical protein